MLRRGVDIPKISHAIIAASSQNPRQFIQRRGRVLRTTKDKLSATIYDCLVVPESEASSSSFEGLVRNELNRAIEFAKTARNKVEATSILRDAEIRVGFEEDLASHPINGDSENE